MRKIIAAALFLPSVALANPGDTACQRLKDEYENVANRSLTNGQADTMGEAEAQAIGVPVDASAAVKCTSILSTRHQQLQQRLKAYKDSLNPPSNSSEID